MQYRRLLVGPAAMARYAGLVSQLGIPASPHLSLPCHIYMNEPPSGTHGIENK